VLLEKSDSRGGTGTPALPGNYVSDLLPGMILAMANRKISAKAAVPMRDP
jgi:hypothetical protein